MKIISELDKTIRKKLRDVFVIGIYGGLCHEDKFSGWILFRKYSEQRQTRAIPPRETRGLRSSPRLFISF